MSRERSLLASFGRLSLIRRTLLIVLTLSAALLLLARIAKPPADLAIRTGSSARVWTAQPGDSTEEELKTARQLAKEPARLIPPSSASAQYAGAARNVDASADGAPLISHAAELAVVTKEFSRSRSTLEDILERHHGYAARLRMVGQSNGSTLTATLRIPSSEFSSTVTDLKTLGNVEREEETADEIIQQRADLEARLINARITLQHLRELLAKDQNANLGETKRQLVGLNSEIARLESERIAWENRAMFANVLFSMREEITPPVESFAAQLRKAGLSGLCGAFNSLSAIVLFGIGYGPVILLWILLIFFPARWIWRKWRPSSEPAASGTV
jgi:Domain of unknown function (DUF4349)